ncbi:hypothetical protein HMPREF1326_00781 [Akkermansia sp. KLE1605]|nr:hypothetical protein HMPREF1326_00781 [Akkermansia sp. KLE1605]
MSLGKVDAFGQAFFFKSPAYGIIIGIDKVFETVGQPQDEQDGGIVAQGYAGVTFFKSSQSCPRNECPFSHQCRRDTPPLTGIADVRPQFLERRFHWARQWGCGFHERNMYHIVSKIKKYVLYMSHYEKYRVHSNPK